MALVAAVGLIWRDWGTFDLHVFLKDASTGLVRPSATVIGLLVVMAALTKSAQFPFHSWLPETMEAPTPVSALMHAGIINAAGRSCSVRPAARPCAGGPVAANWWRTITAFWECSPCGPRSRSSEPWPGLQSIR